MGNNRYCNLKKIIIYKSLILSILIIFLIVSDTMAAQKTDSGTGAATTDSSGCTVVNGITTCKLDNPLASGTTDVAVIAGQVIKGFLGIVGALALYSFVKGGAAWFMSRGNPEKISQGYKTMFWAFLGLILAFISYGILGWVIGLITKGN